MPIPSLNPQISDFRPVGRKILVRRNARAEKVGEIFLPENKRFSELASGTVESVGLLVDEVAKGDTVFFATQLGYTKIEMNGETFEVIPMEHVGAVSPFR